MLGKQLKNVLQSPGTLWLIRSGPKHNENKNLKVNQVTQIKNQIKSMIKKQIGNDF